MRQTGKPGKLANERRYHASAKRVVMQAERPFWPWIVIGVVVLGACAWWLFRDDLPQLTTPAVSEPQHAISQAASSVVNTIAELLPNRTSPPGHASALPTAPSPPPVAADPKPAPAPPSTVDPSLPGLSQSDDDAWRALQALISEPVVLGCLLRSHLIERLVATIDGLTQAHLAPQTQLLMPVPGTLKVTTGPNGTATLTAANAQRYAPFVQALVAADPDAVVRTYRHAYPLLQEAYVNLGYPDRQFQTRLLEVIDHLQATPIIATAPVLSQDDHGHWQFVEPRLQGYSVGQRALLRLSPEQATAVKAQLQRIRQALLHPAAN